jgi:hypothetical protein
MGLPHDPQRGVHRARSAAEDAGRSRTVEILARVGYATKGVVYAIIGVLAMKVALGTGGGRLTGGEGAVRTIGEQPFGQWLLLFAGVGLAAYAIWRFVQAIVDPERHEPGAKSAAKRVGYGVSGVAHASLAVLALQLALGAGGGGGDSRATWLGRLLELPAGRWIVVAIGAAVAGFAIQQLVKAVRASFMDGMKTAEMSATARTWARRLGRIGLASRSVVFAIMAWFLVLAGLRASPGQAKGVGEALATLGTRPWGILLLAVIALGLLAYGVYMVVAARYRRIPA